MKVGVFFGGRSVEHDVSIITGNEIITNLDKNKYEIIPVYISREGEWFTGEKLLDLRYSSQISEIIPSLKKVFLTPLPNVKGLMYVNNGFSLGKNKIISLDVIIPALHGLNGEDGTIQGLFELSNIPFVGPGVLGSSVGMDKVLMKSVFKGHDFPILKYTWFTRKEWETNKESVINKITTCLQYPMFVKPSNLGSSIGINKAKNIEELHNAIEIAVQYDRRVIVEQGVNNPTEINCSALGVDEEVEVSLCEHPVAWQEFLSFEDKYLRWGGGTKGESSGKISCVKGKGNSDGPSSKIPADIPDALTQKIQGLARDVFKALDCKGVSRIDFLIDNEDMNVYVNEINTLPGSFSHYLWSPMGITFTQLLDKIIDVAIKSNIEKNKNIYTFDSELLGKINSALKDK